MNNFYLVISVLDVDGCLLQGQDSVRDYMSLMSRDDQQGTVVVEVSEDMVANLQAMGLELVWPVNIEALIIDFNLFVKKQRKG